MFDKLLSFTAPHLCLQCTQAGSLLCDNCKTYITDEPYSQCLVCHKPAMTGNLCGVCNLPYSRAWCVGEREGLLERLIDVYKFENAYAAHVPLADLLCACLPDLPSETVVVPVPTISSHIRERGYDHTLLLARRVVKTRGYVLESHLRRATQTKQRDARRAQRLKQAQTAFSIAGKLDPDRPYLLIDDVMTTGATLYYAAEQLRLAGAMTIWVAIIARQPLD